MKTIVLKNYHYKSIFGSTLMVDINVCLDDESYDSYLNDGNIENYDYGIPGDEIRKVELQAAKQFLVAKFIAVLRGEADLTSGDFKAIQTFVNVNQSDFALLIGIDRGSYTNLLRREACSRPTALAALEMLGREIRRPGFAIALSKALKESSSSDALIEELLLDRRAG